MAAECTCGTAGGRPHLHWCVTQGQPAGRLTLQAQPSKWSCIPTAFGMIMGVKAQELIDEVGHHDENGFHEQELAWVALKRGWSFATFHAAPTFEPTVCKAQGCFKGDAPSGPCGSCQGTGYEIHDDVFNVPTIDKLREKYSGVLIGWVNGKPHAVAWDADSKKIYDPNFEIYDASRFTVETFMVGTHVGT